LIAQVTITIPCSFAVFFSSMLLDRGDTPDRARLFRDLATPINVEAELKDSPDLTSEVFGFLSGAIALVGLLSLLLWFSTKGSDRATVVGFAAITLLVALLLRFIHSPSHSPADDGAGKPESAAICPEQPQRHC